MVSGDVSGRQLPELACQLRAQQVDCEQQRLAGQVETASLEVPRSSTRGWALSSRASPWECRATQGHQVHSEGGAGAERGPCQRSTLTKQQRQQQPREAAIVPVVPQYAVRTARPRQQAARSLWYVQHVGGRYITEEAGRRSPYVQYGGPGAYVSTQPLYQSQASNGSEPHFIG